MLALIRAELLKLRTVRSTWWFAGAATAYVAANVAVVMAAMAAPGGLLDAGDAGVLAVMGQSASAGLFTLLIGILVATGEFRHNTATATFLITPGRVRVAAAKAVAVAVVSLVVALIATAVTLAITVPWLSALGFDLSIFSGTAIGALAGAVAGTVLYGLLGFGFGTAVRNQIGAIVVALVWTFVLGSAVGIFLPSVGRWLPDLAVSALVGQQEIMPQLLSVWGGALVMIGWVAAALAAGTVLLKRRDLA